MHASVVTRAAVVSSHPALTIQEALSGAMTSIGGGVAHLASRRDRYSLMEVAGAESEPQFRSRAGGDDRHTPTDYTLARNLIGYAPQVGLRDGSSRELEWLSCAGRV